MSQDNTIPKRRVGQHGKYKVKNSNRARGLVEYRKTHNWPEEVKQYWTDERKKKQSDKTTEFNKTRWQNWSEKKKARVSAHLSKALTGRKMPQSHRDKAAARVKTMNQDPNTYKVVSELNESKSTIYQECQAKGFDMEWLKLKAMDKAAVEKLQIIIKKLP